MSLADFSTLADAIQSILIGLAVIIGGVWALFRYWSLDEAKKAKAELDTLKKSLQERSVLRVTIEASRLDAPGKFPAQVLTRISLHNMGNCAEVIDLSKSQLLVSKVARFEGEKVIYETPSASALSATIMSPVSSSINPKEEQSYHFLSPVYEAGTYYLLFLAQISQRAEAIEEVDHSEAGFPGGFIAWSANTYILIE